MTTKALLVVTAIVEILTGTILVLAPVLFVRLVFGLDLSGAGFPLARLAGFGLFSLGVACWPSPVPTALALRAMLLYNFLAVTYLTYLRVARDVSGTLMLVGIAVHGLLTILLAWASFRDQSRKTSD